MRKWLFLHFGKKGTMITINNVAVQFGGLLLFKDISFQVNRDDRIGLVGRNGSGKTTLLRLIKGLDQPEEGEVSVSREVETGYLPQQMVHEDGKTVFDEALSAFSEVLHLEREIERINRLLSGRTDYNSADYMEFVAALTEYNERLGMLGGDTVRARVEKILYGLGFRAADFERATREFSGGWRMRIELAKILLREPDLLLLDEPTNHLDIESIQWLEEFLAGFRGAVILISHDRAFLDALTNRTIEISLGRIYDYKAPYSRYVELRRERRERQEAAYRNQQKMIQENERFIERFRYKATKAPQVQSRIKQLEKMERVEIDQEDTSSINVRFPPAPRSGSIVAEMSGVGKSFGQVRVLDNVDMIIERGEKVAFVGRNGEGKTTLSRIIAGELDHEGKVKMGYNVKTAYFAQNQDELLDREKTVFETIDSIAEGDTGKQVRSILGAFLFSDDDVDKKVGVLSGGERSRLAIAKLLLEPCNFLVLDEPTNHLDMQSREILKRALLNYEGAIIVVSHDRDFLDGLVGKVYEFKNRNVGEHTGGIYDFLRKRKLSSLGQLDAPSGVKQEKSSGEKEKTPSQNKRLYEQKKEYDRRIRKIDSQLERTESTIEELEEKIAEMDARLAEAGEDIEKLNEEGFFQCYEKYKSRLASEMEKWEHLAGSLEEEQKKKPF